MVDVATLLINSGVGIWTGILGAIIILAAWCYETLESIKLHKSLVDLRFAIVYLFGNVLLVFYSIVLGDPVFLLINAALVLLVLFEVLYTVGWKFGRQRRK
jgi:lipid-A-disaccharide synthase-like uncharacterized protein